MTRDATTVVLADPEQTLAALEDLGQWAKTLDMAYAWASTSRGTAPHWAALPLARVRRALVGLHFSQTEPWALRRLAASPGRLRVIHEASGVFHPKLTIGRRGNLAKAVLGSSNFTGGGFGWNTELNVQVCGPCDCEPMKSIIAFFDEQWEGVLVKAVAPDDPWLDEYEASQAPVVHPPLPPLHRRHVSSVQDLRVGWSEYFDILKSAELEYAALGFDVQVFGSPTRASYLNEAEACREAFLAEPSFAKMSVDTQYLIAGLLSQSTGYFGRNGGA